MSGTSTPLHEEIIIRLLKNYDKVMHLKLFIVGSNNLKNMYYAAVNNHNNKLLNNQFIDSGFDLFLPENEDSKEYEKWGDSICFYGTGRTKNPVNKVDFKIKCSAKMICDTGKSFNSGYYMYPRSSISKTNLRLANNVGIIDSGYRGNLIGMFDVVNIDSNLKSNNKEEPDFFAKTYDRLLQICAPGLIPIYVEIVEDFDELGLETERGSGGFGSTGK